MTLSELLAQNQRLAQRETEKWEIDGPHVNDDGSQWVRVLVRPQTEATRDNV